MAEKLQASEGLRWRKSTYSSTLNGTSQCVEAAAQGGTLFLRDSMAHEVSERVILKFGADAGRALVTRIKNGELPGT